MEYFLQTIIVAVAVIILTPIIFYLNRKANIKKESKMDKGDFVMSYSLFWTVISLILALGMTALLVYLNFFQSFVSWEINLLIMLIWLLFLICTLALSREKIIVKGDTMIVTPVFGKTKAYNFQDIKKLIHKDWGNGFFEYKVYTDKKVFSISSAVVGFGLFMERVRGQNIKIETLAEQKKNLK